MDAADVLGDRNEESRRRGWRYRGRNEEWHRPSLSGSPVLYWQNFKYYRRKGGKNIPDEVPHGVKARLYHNYLAAQADDYIIRTDDEKGLSIEEIYAILKNRGLPGTTMNWWHR